MELEWRGFAFEGAAMGLALLDFLTPWRRDRIASFLRGTGDAHTYMIHVGVGWVWARAPFGFRRRAKKIDPLLGWLVFDGWGFHEGFFFWPKYIAGQPAPKNFPVTNAVFLIRGLAVRSGSSTAETSNLSDRQLQIFLPTGSPICGVALVWPRLTPGIVSESSLVELLELAGEFQPQLAQGAAFAAKARQRAGNLTDYTNLAAGVLCQMSASDAARLCDQTLENLPTNVDLPAYEIWRQRIQNHFQKRPKLQAA